MNGMRRQALLVTVLAGTATVVLAACATPGGGGASPSASSVSSPAGPDDPQQAVLTVAHVGGLTPPLADYDVPSVSMWTDGRVITPGAQIEIYPPPALPSVITAQIDPAAMPGVLDTLADGLAGLPDDFGFPPTADVPSTVVTWRGDGGTQTWTAASLGVGDEEPSDALTAEQIRAREQLTRVVDYAQAVASGGIETVPVTDQGVYVPSAWYVWSTPYEPIDDLPQEPRKWPGPQLSGGPGWACQVVDGEQAQAVTAALTDAVTTTPWRSAGKRWSVSVRPVLPGEPLTCPE